MAAIAAEVTAPTIFAPLTVRLVTPWASTFHVAPSLPLLFPTVCRRPACGWGGGGSCSFRGVRVRPRLPPPPRLAMELGRPVAPQAGAIVGQRGAVADEGPEGTVGDSSSSLHPRPFDKDGPCIVEDASHSSSDVRCPAPLTPQGKSQECHCPSKKVSR